MVKNFKSIIEYGARIAFPPQLYWTTAKLYYEQVRDYDIHKYNDDLDPYKIYWINPFDIQYRSRMDHQDRWGKFGSVSSNELKGERISSVTEIWEETFQLRFFENVPWEETPAVQRALKRIEDNTEARRNTKKGYLELCNRWDRLFEQLVTEGYKSQRQLMIDQQSDPVKRLPSIKSFKSSICDEMTIDIGRQGEPLFVDGEHRLALARLLEIEHIPVVVLRRHMEWMQRSETF